MINLILKTVYFGAIISIISVLLSAFLNILYILFLFFIIPGAPVIAYAAGLFSFFITIAYWTQTARYAAAVTGLRTLTDQPPIGSVLFAVLVLGALCYIFTQVLVIGTALAAAKIELPEINQLPALMTLLTNPSTQLVGAWSVLDGASDNHVLRLAAMIMSALLFAVWIMILVPLATGVASRRSDCYGAAMVGARIAFTLGASYLILCLWRGAMQPVILGWFAEELEVAGFVAVILTTFGLVSYWLALLTGFVMAFECLILARPTRSASTPPTNPADYRSLRKSWEQGNQTNQRPHC